MPVRPEDLNNVLRGLIRATDILEQMQVETHRNTVRVEQFDARIRELRAQLDHVGRLLQGDGEGSGITTRLALLTHRTDAIEAWQAERDEAHRQQDQEAATRRWQLFMAVLTASGLVSAVTSAVLHR